MQDDTVSDVIEVAGDIAAVGSGPLAPIILGAKELLKYGYGFLTSDYENRNKYKPGVWYDNPDYVPDIYSKGGPSIKQVPLSPSVDPASWTAAGKAKWKPVDSEENSAFSPAPILGPNQLSNLSYGWSQHYEPQIPVVKINTKGGKVNLHPPKSSSPNATMVPSGGFSKYNK